MEAVTGTPEIPLIAETNPCKLFCPLASEKEYGVDPTSSCRFPADDTVAVLENSDAEVADAAEATEVTFVML
jgi:hypothetical protein